MPGAIFGYTPSPDELHTETQELLEELLAKFIAGARAVIPPTHQLAMNEADMVGSAATAMMQGILNAGPLEDLSLSFKAYLLGMTFASICPGKIPQQFLLREMVSGYMHGMSMGIGDRG